MSQTIEQLCTDWLAAKKAEQKANAERVAIEDAIVALTGKRDEGAKTVDATGFKITVTGKISRKMDWKAWETIKAQIPADMHPVKLKPELDEKGVKWLADNQPDIYKLLPLEVKPAKTAVEVKPVEVAA
mgnify:FL=1|jgi:hypothetical protein